MLMSVTQGCGLQAMDLSRQVNMKCLTVDILIMFRDLNVVSLRGVRNDDIDWSACGYVVDRLRLCGTMDALHQLGIWGVLKHDEKLLEKYSTPGVYHKMHIHNW